MLKKYALILASVCLGLSVFSSSVFAAETTAKHHTEQVKKAEDTAPVNINTADIKKLMTLKFVGKKRAEAIIAYRDKNGAFNSIDDVKRVKGITDKIIEANKERIRFS